MMEPTANQIAARERVKNAVAASNKKKNYG